MTMAQSRLWILVYLGSLNAGVTADYRLQGCDEHHHLAPSCPHGAVHLTSLTYGAHSPFDDKHACIVQEGDCHEIQTVDQASTLFPELSNFKKRCDGKTRCIIPIHVVHLAHCWFAPFSTSDYMIVRFDCVGDKTKSPQPAGSASENTSTPPSAVKNGTFIMTDSDTSSTTYSTEVTTGGDNNGTAQASTSDGPTSNLLVLIILAAAAAILLLVLLINFIIFYLIRQHREARDEEHSKLITESTQTDTSESLDTKLPSYDETFEDDPIYADLDILPRGPPPPKPPRSPGYGALTQTDELDDNDPAYSTSARLPNEGEITPRTDAAIQEEDEDLAYATFVRPDSGTGISPQSETGEHGNIGNPEKVVYLDIGKQSEDEGLYAEVMKVVRSSPDANAPQNHADSESDQSAGVNPEEPQGVPHIEVDGDLYAQVVKTDRGLSASGQEQ